MKNYTFRTRKELDKKVLELRAQGYNIITFCNTFREMEKGDEIIVLEVKR